MHPEEFWTEIIAHPQDLQARLRYADWLEQRGDPRGEFIRLQCSRAQLPDCHALTIDLETRERELLCDHEDRWLGELRDLIDWCVFRRGFVEEICISAERFVRHAEMIFRREPVLEVHLDNVRPALDALLKCTAFDGVAFLDLSYNPLRDGAVQRLVGSRRLTRLEGLNLSSTHLGDGAVRAIARTTNLPHLRELYLCDNHISPAGVDLLMQSPLVDQLSVLSLRHNDCDSASLGPLQRRLGERLHV